jgi:hypothetical protein
MTSHSLVPMRRAVGTIAELCWRVLETSHAPP